MQTDLRSTSADDVARTTPAAPAAGAAGAAPDRAAAPPLRVLLAVTNDDAEAAALSVAHALATRRHADITALSAYDPARYGVPGAASTVLGFADAILGPDFREERKVRLREHIAAHFGAAQPWTTDVDLGDAATCIARGAARHDSNLVLLGLHHHGTVARALGDDTARAVMRRVAVPILAVRPTLGTLPARIAVGVDFSDASTHVARTALELLDDDGTLELVYVRPSIPLGATEETQGLARIVAGGIEAAFTQLIDALHAPPSVHVARVVREGNPADELLRHAEATHPDLIAVGPQRHSRLSRLLLGSVTSAILDDGRWSVLLTPPAPESAQTEADDDGDGGDPDEDDASADPLANPRGPPRLDWSPSLDEGTARASKSAMVQQTLFRARGLGKTYRMGEVDVRALRDVDLDLYGGEVVVILGPSGSGKSTLLNILGGLDSPSEGDVHFRDHDLVAATDRELTRYRREHVGFVFQFYNLLPSLTAIENVALVTEIADDPMDPADALEMVGLTERAEHFPSQLSGGEQQRVAIARAIAKRPDVLLCDEPTGALDVTTGRVVLDALLRANSDLATTVVLITHNAAIAAVADRVVTMASGGIMAIERNPRRVAPASLLW